MQPTYYRVVNYRERRNNHGNLVICITMTNGGLEDPNAVPVLLEPINRPLVVKFMPTPLPGEVASRTGGCRVMLHDGSIIYGTAVASGEFVLFNSDE